MKLDLMKILLFLCLSSVLIACNHETSDKTLLDQDLSGTWMHTLIDEYYEMTTDTYIGFVAIESELIFNDDETGVEYHECRHFGSLPRTASKSKSNLELEGYSVNFSVLNPNVLETPAFEPPTDGSVPPDQYRLRRYRLVKVSEDLNVDRGMLTLNGPVSVAESDQVCLWHVYRDPNLLRTYELIVPYDDDYLSLRIRYENRPGVGIINYDLFNSTPNLESFNINSGASNFWSIVGSNTLGVTTATINISESTDDLLAGTFAFIGQDMGNYSGEFVMETSY